MLWLSPLFLLLCCVVHCLCERVELCPNDLKPLKLNERATFCLIVAPVSAIVGPFFCVASSLEL